MFNGNYFHPTVMEINLNNFKNNIEEIKKITNNTEIMPIIKANGYGTYINTRLDILNMFNIVAVACPSEGIFLRKLGYKKEIFILNEPYYEDIENIIKYKLTIGVSDEDFIDKLGKHKNKVKVHIEIDTGMGRTGIQKEDTKEFIDYLKKYKNIIIEGIYTHLSSADTDDKYTKLQLDNFNYAVNIAKKELPTLKYIHAASSNGILNYKESYYNLVRPGKIIYGYSLNKKNENKKMNLKPVAVLKTKITFLKTVPKNTSISYGRTFITKKETKIATLPIGYADGLPRSLGNNYHLLLNNQKVKIIGTICMDSIMIDVTNVKDVKLYDTVYIWDNNLLTIEMLAEKAKTIPSEILSRISPRIPRKFID